MDKKAWSGTREDYKKKIEKLEKTIRYILNKHVKGFNTFFNFRLRKDGEIELRFNYNYGADDNSMSFTGVGYIELEELYKGFK